MADRKATFHPAAEAETQAAQDWYAERSAIAASAFTLQVDQMVRRAVDAPERWPLQSDGTRRILFPRFPFTLVYRMRAADLIEIVAVAHQRRRPGYWKGR